MKKQKVRDNSLNNWKNSISKILSASSTLLIFVLAIALFSSLTLADPVIIENGEVNVASDLTVDQNTLFVDSSTNRVGIMTSTPEFSLDVKRSGDNAFRVGSDTGNDFTIDVAGGQGLVSLNAGARAVANLYNFIGTRGASRIQLHDGYIAFYTSNNARGVAGEVAHGMNAGQQKMSIDRAGRVAINNKYALNVLDIGTSTASASGISFNGEPALTAKRNDAWLRINQNKNFSAGTFTPGLFRADGGFQVDGKWSIAANNYWHRAQSNVEDRYGYFEVRQKNGSRGAYFGSGRPGKYVPLVVQNGNALAILGGKIGILATNPKFQLDLRTSGDNPFRIGADNGNDFTIDVAGGQGLVNLVAGAKAVGNNYQFTGTRGASRIMLHDGMMRFFTSSVPKGTKGENVPGLNTVRMELNSQGNLGVGLKGPISRLQVDNGYLQIDALIGAPPNADCDHNAEAGRMKISTNLNRIYICNAASRGWDWIPLNN